MHLQLFLIVITVSIFIYLFLHRKKRNKPNIEIVVARYNEDVAWTKQYPNVVIYNKGDDDLDDTYPNVKNLKNVGREGHTYYTHIYENYYNLSDYTIFLQGNPDDHVTNVIEKINRFYDDDFLEIDVEYLGRDNYKYKLSGDSMFKDVPLKKIYSKLFGKAPEDKDMTYNAGAHFIVSKERILKRPREFYLKIIDMLKHDINPIEGHAIERFHKLIFS